MLAESIWLKDTHGKRARLLSGLWACLQIAAEDDAIVSHSTVELPVQAFAARLEALVTDLARLHLPALGTAATPESQLQVCRYDS